MEFTITVLTTPTSYVSRIAPLTSGTVASSLTVVRAYGSVYVITASSPGIIMGSMPMAGSPGGSFKCIGNYFATEVTGIFTNQFGSCQIIGNQIDPLANGTVRYQHVQRIPV